MRRALEESFQTSGKRVQFPISTGGWNARDPVASMPEKDAIILDNLFPRLTDLILRKGYTTHITAGDEQVQSLLPYQQTDGTGELFAVTATGVFDSTSAATLDEADDVIVSVTNGQWQSVNFTTPGGSFLFACNGEDDILLYDGTSWVSVDSTSTPAITGVTTADIVNCSIFKNRIILVEKDSLSFWYLPLNSIAGAASEFLLGSVFNRGGYLVATATWTLDAGEGADDYFVAITSKGEVAVYKGTDPDSAATFALVGVYYLAEPIGRRCFLKIAGDLFVITTSGLYPLSKALISANVNRAVAVTDKIVDAWVETAEAYKENFGWDITILPALSMLLVNIPLKVVDDITYSYQYVMNTQTGAWCRFAGMNATCWCEFNGNLYFGYGNKVAKAWSGHTDDSVPIRVNWKTAFNGLVRFPLKKINLIRIHALSDGNVRFWLGVDNDYSHSPLTESSSVESIETSIWDTAIWDEAKWSGDALINAWKSVNHKPGLTLSLRLRVDAENINIKILAVDLIVEGMAALM